jgi:hypothetical protein
MLSVSILSESILSVSMLSESILSVSTRLSIPAPGCPAPRRARCRGFG